MWRNLEVGLSSSFRAPWKGTNASWQNRLQMSLRHTWPSSLIPLNGVLNAPILMEPCSILGQFSNWGFLVGWVPGVSCSPALPPVALCEGCEHVCNNLCVWFKKYKTFSVLIYTYINTSGNWKNEKLCGNTTPAGRSVFTQFSHKMFYISFII